MSNNDLVLLMVVTGCILLAGCTWSPENQAVTPVPPATTSSAPAVSLLPVAATTVPLQVVTIIHQVSLVKDVRDSELWFSLQVPVEWNVTTRRLANPENFEGQMYQTNLVANNTFYIHTFTNYRSRDQNYRDECMRWIPAPVRTVVTINGIVFDRFESVADGRTRVTYVARQTSMNERGYVSVLAFTANTSKRFEKEDYETVVSSFRYYGRDAVGTMPGEEILRIATPPEEEGGVHSAVRSGSSPGSSGGSGGCSRCGG